MNLEDTGVRSTVAADRKVDVAARKLWVKPAVESFEVVGETEGLGGNPHDGTANLC